MAPVADALPSAAGRWRRRRGVGFLGIDYRDNAGSASLALFFLILV
jgi:hypothetical protein